MNSTAHRLAILGALCQTAIPVGVIATILRMESAIGHIDTRTDDMQVVMKQIGEATSGLGAAFDATLWAIGFAMLGLVPFIIALTKFSYRQKWAFWFSCIYGVVLTIFSLLTAPFGIFLMIYALIHKSEFLKNVPLGITVGPNPAEPG